MSVSSSRSPRQAEIRRRTRAVVRVLEKFLGMPDAPARRPPPLAMLIATILSQNTSDQNSHRAYTNLTRCFPSWSALAAAPPRRIRAAIRCGGMAEQKSLRIREGLHCIRERFGGYDLSALEGMTDREVIAELTRIKGVGVKTAACVLLFSLGRDVFPVDTHVHRVCSRLGLVPGSRSPEETFERMEQLVPRGKAYSFHTNLIRFGRMVCRAQTPVCGSCPLYKECIFPGRKRNHKRLRRPSKTDHRFMLLDNVGTF